jgi:pimeloyl-ACP methyl ester carboxylesterase
MQFGEANSLVGTVTVPDESDAPLQPLAFVFLNAGFLHRVGPHRLNVRAARLFARHGYAAIRFDFSGLGDSNRLQTAESQAERWLRELRAAMSAATEATRVERFILVGLCSGTDPCIFAAMEDPRVAGVMLMDPFAFPTFRTHLLYNLRRLKEEASPVRWLQAAGRKLQMLARKAGPSNTESPVFVTRELPPREEFERWFSTMLGRGVHVFALYTGDFPKWYNYAGQFTERHGTFGNTPLLKLDYRPEANHTFTQLQLQTRLLQDILDWAAGVTEAQRRREAA